MSDIQRNEQKMNGGAAPVVEILWTGGFDSSFRVVQLSRCAVQIQPYYLSDDRNSEANELRAISDITAFLQKHPDTKATFLPLQIVKKSERIIDPEISAAYQRMRETDFFGTQYDWLACFATKHPGLELSIHKDDKAILLIQKHGKLKEIHDDIIGSYWVLDVDNSPADLAILFQNYHFPLAYETKLQMRDEFQSLGYAEVINKTWFCYHPIHNEPCGMCNPCHYTIEEGMTERFSKAALRRYRRSKSIFYRGAKKIRNKIKKH